MTKAVRIENADTSKYGVQVEVWDMDWQNPNDRSKDKLINIIDLPYPTSMVNTSITSTRYLIVKELLEPKN